MSLRVGQRVAINPLVSPEQIEDETGIPNVVVGLVGQVMEEPAPDNPRWWVVQLDRGETLGFHENELEEKESET